MRPLLALSVPALVLTLACGSAKLTRSEVEKDLRKDYPVVVALRIVQGASAIKGSPEHARLVQIQEQLTQKGWFTVSRQADGDRERFEFQPTDKAPKDLKPSAKGWELPAAEAQLVDAGRPEIRGSEARVPYRVRLAKPTAHFPVFQAIYKANLGDTKVRQAVYKKEGRAWILVDTNESFKKGE